jgi:hypothetical protein
MLLTPVPPLQPCYGNSAIFASNLLKSVTFFSKLPTLAPFAAILLPTSQLCNHVTANSVTFAVMFGDGLIDLRVYTPKKLLSLNDNFY